MFSRDPDEAFGHFEREFRIILDKHAPLKVIQNRTHYVPYISPEIKKNMEERNKLKDDKRMCANMQGLLTEKSMFFLSWLTARGSGTGSVCLITDTDSPTKTTESRRSKPVQLINTGQYTLVGINSGYSVKTVQLEQSV